MISGELLTGGLAQTGGVWTDWTLLSCESLEPAAGTRTGTTAAVVVVEGEVADIDVVAAVVGSVIET